MKLKGNKQTKKIETIPQEVQLYMKFLERKRSATFEGVARFCVMTTGLERAKFIEYKSPAIREPHVWMWIVEHEKLCRHRAVRGDGEVRVQLLP